MDKHEAYKEGFSRGYEAVSVNVDETPELLRDPERLTSVAFESEMNARQFAGFAFIACELNSRPANECLWMAYENGVAAGIQALINQYL
jgi:hypothetical protein